MFRSLKLLFISIFLVSGSCFALSSEEFDEQYRDLNGQLSKAVFTNMLYSRDYDDKKVPLSEKLESKSKWLFLLVDISYISTHFHQIPVSKITK